jgi:hypothetical protein
MTLRLTSPQWRRLMEEPAQVPLGDAPLAEAQPCGKLSLGKLAALARNLQQRTELGRSGNRLNACDHVYRLFR